jgi:YD repeat-containing protein
VFPNVSYYVDNQLYTQRQNGETLTYTYDPDGRTVTTITEGKTTSETTSPLLRPRRSAHMDQRKRRQMEPQLPRYRRRPLRNTEGGEPAILQLHDSPLPRSRRKRTNSFSTYNATEFSVPQPGATPRHPGIPDA